jgi:LmbE family N-acetylglucosaminyl deacetylase
MPIKNLATVVGLPILCVFTVFVSESYSGQALLPPEDRVELGVALRKLNSTGTFMMITAHPDDENNALLALQAKGRGHRAVLLTATRGDGGQNEIGAELFDALAVLRTEELLAAHRLDGAEQYFTRAVDFGYSFSREETLERWGHESILGDLVRIIRKVRPDVITALSPEGEFGGQHHQASAILAHEAFSAAADPARYSEQLSDGLRPWQAGKFYYSEMFAFGRRPGREPSDEMTTVDLGGYDPLLSRTYAEIGSHARSMHKCQGMSPLLALPGPFSGRYRLVERILPEPDRKTETSLFDGIDTTIEGLVKFVEVTPSAMLRAGLAAVSQHAVKAVHAFERQQRSAVSESILAGLIAVRRLREQLPELSLGDRAREEIDFRLELKERQFVTATVLAHGLRFEALADDGVVTQGQAVTVSSSVANYGSSDVVIAGVSSEGFNEAFMDCHQESLAASDVYKCSSKVTIPQNAKLTDIHWIQEPGADRYIFQDDVPFGAPFRPTPFRLTFQIKFGSTLVNFERPIQHRYGDDIFAGEKRAALKIVPKLTVGLTPTTAVIPLHAGTLEFRATVTNADLGISNGNVTLDLPAGWTSTPEAARVLFTREDESRVVRFLVSPDNASAGEYRISAGVESQGLRFNHGFQAVEYPHTERRHLVRRAEANIAMLNIRMESDLLVGYVDGVGDAVPPAIEQLGANVEFIDADRLAWGDLAHFDVIVTGVRAYERRADLRSHNDRLLDYVAGGGTLIVQYNKFEFNSAQYGPRPVKVSRDRVTDEAAPVRILAPDHPVFRWPNEVDESTWSGWVQERGLYFLGDKDPAYVDLIELADTFEWNPGVKRGALVEIRHGRGRWLYVGLGLWRQLPAGTPGAYQLLANLLSLGSVEAQ